MRIFCKRVKANFCYRNTATSRRSSHNRPLDRALRVKPSCRGTFESPPSRAQWGTWITVCAIDSITDRPPFLPFLPIYVDSVVKSHTQGDTMKAWLASETNNTSRLRTTALLLGRIVLTIAVTHKVRDGAFSSKVCSFVVQWSYLGSGSSFTQAWGNMIGQSTRGWMRLFGQKRCATIL